MALSSNIAEYEDCREHLDRALSANVGIRITLPSKGEAIHLRQRLYKLRQLEKLKSTEIFEVGDPRRGVSVYDNLRVFIEENVLEIRQVSPIHVEEL